MIEDINLRWKHLSWTTPYTIPSMHEYLTLTKYCKQYETKEYNNDLSRTELTSWENYSKFESVLQFTMGTWLIKSRFSFWQGCHVGTIITMPLSGLLTKYGFDGGWASVFYCFGECWKGYISELYNNPKLDPVGRNVSFHKAAGE